MAMTRVGNVNLYCEEWGSGEPLLLIMGMGANTTDWEPQIQAIRKEYRLIAFDNRGSGRSDQVDEPVAMERLADDAAALLDSFGVERSHIFGMSMGGMIAQELALRHPQRLLTLILGATMCGGLNAVHPPMKRIMKWIGTRDLPPKEAAEAGLPFLYSPEFINDMKDDLIRSSLRTVHLHAPKNTIHHQLTAISRFDSYHRLPSIQAPTLVMTGSEDLIVPAENSRILANRIPQAELVEFGGMGHGFLRESSLQVNETLLAFLRRYHGTASETSLPHLC